MGAAPGAPRRPLLGSADIQSLADLANSFDVTRRVRVIPIAWDQLLYLLAAALIPTVPLVFLFTPLEEVILRGLSAFDRVRKRSSWAS